jgi:hypothetical protein
MDFDSLLVMLPDLNDDTGMLPLPQGIACLVLHPDGVTSLERRYLLGVQSESLQLPDVVVHHGSLPVGSSLCPGGAQFIPPWFDRDEVPDLSAEHDLL